VRRAEGKNAVQNRYEYEFDHASSGPQDKASAL
jgi:hypothetical protein